ncbi:MAG TPA: glycosyltransferase family 2 protein [Candidatus Rifleibacterium sp.]|nr:glycosyltransferase family 2 protein [Candidatus Rifleibacterium sp.]HPT47417.1 glycosyltransferase family 2 protein [Candidatus Rifleibacterium sp.]
MSNIFYSVAIPVYNEAESLEELVRRVDATMSGLGKPWELLLVDDGSTDGSFARLVELKQRFPAIRGLRFSKNNGQTAAMAAGIKAARGAVIITLDADLQNDPADIPLLLDHLGADCAAAVGWRKKRNDNFVRRVSSKIANWIRNVISSETIKDTGCSLKAFRAEYIQPIELFEGMHRFLPTLVKMNGGRVVEVEVSHHPRALGVSKYNVWNRILRSFLDLLAIRWMKWRKLRYQIDEQV